MIAIALCGIFAAPTAAAAEAVIVWHPFVGLGVFPCLWIDASKVPPEHAIIHDCWGLP